MTDVAKDFVLNYFIDVCLKAEKQPMHQCQEEERHAGKNLLRISALHCTASLEVSYNMSYSICAKELEIQLRNLKKAKYK